MDGLGLPLLIKGAILGRNRSGLHALTACMTLFAWGFEAGSEGTSFGGFLREPSGLKAEPLRDVGVSFGGCAASSSIR